MADVSLGRSGREAIPRWLAVAGWVGMLVFTFYACTRMVAAGDTWVAMACGRHFVEHGVNTVEPFSVNSHKAGPTAEEVKTWPPLAQWITGKVGLDTVRRWHPTGWVNQNWLTHVIFYKLTTALGSETEPYYDALVLWKFAIYILAGIALYATARLYGVHPVLAAIFVCFGMVIGRSFFDIRPAGFSNLLVTVLILILALASYRNVLYIWLLVPLVIFWSNVHGGYVYAFIVLVPFLAWHAIMNLPRRWMIAAYSVLLWLVLCAMGNRFSHHEHLTAIPLGHDVLFYLTLAALGGSFALSYRGKVKDEALIAYHVAVSCILFLVFLPRFFPDIPLNVKNMLRSDEIQDLDEFIGLARLSYIGIFTFAMALGAIVLAQKEKIVRVMSVRGILHTAAAGAVAFVAMVVFNPFHLTNLTHTFVISISKHAERWRNVHEWHRAFDFTNPVGTAVPFLVLYVLGWVVLVAWVVVLIYAARLTDRPAKKHTKPAFEYAWPKMDLGLLIIAAMTIYMAIRSRRFIPIAGYVACPVLALLIQDIAGRLSVITGLRRQDKVDPALLAPAVSAATLVAVTAALATGAVWYLLVERWLFVAIPGYPGFMRPRLGLILMAVVLIALAFAVSAVLYAAAKWRATTVEGARHREPLLEHSVQTAAVLLCVAVVGFSVWFGVKFKRVYLDPWPLDAKYKSVFMRMTASYSKPFEACEFMRLNKLSGNMFNYWTEGGFIAWGQEPDPETGRIPLQLFMDGRAQAAYDVATFDRWSDILSGGPLPYQAVRARRELTVSEYAQIGKWVGEQLKQHGVWIVLMPGLEFKKVFTRGLEYSQDWRTVYTDDKQKMFVDVKSPKGAALYEGIFTGRTIYPNEYLSCLALGHNLLLYPDVAQKKRGLEYLIKALNDYPSPAPMIDMLFIGLDYPELRPRIDEVCRQYAKTFEENEAVYARQDGFNFRLHVAWMALARMAQVAKATNNTKASETFRDRIERYQGEIDRLEQQKKW